ncbi:unnamed protein product [Trichogramma brassicae]|uniref:HTH psq-type domain-containing protein n=1 Tax=Trichogramma brassicae TaxID=86971 RepID=A0A6H5I304_9HYME|nr:unnamed protein product [Trichogramma brassicae]
MLGEDPSTASSCPSSDNKRVVKTLLPEDKLKAIECVLIHGQTKASVARTYKVPESTFRDYENADSNGNNEVIRVYTITNLVEHPAQMRPPNYNGEKTFCPCARKGVAARGSAPEFIKTKLLDFFVGFRSDILYRFCVNRTFGPSKRIFSEILTIVDYISLSIYINCYTPAIIMSDQLVRRQNELKDKLTKSYGNFAKLGQKQMTEGANEVRLARHREWWEEFERNHEELVNSVDYDPNIPYFREGCYNITEEAYMVSLGSYLDLQKYYEGLKPRSQVVGPPAPMSRLSLKPIEPPDLLRRIIWRLGGVP